VPVAQIRSNYDLEARYSRLRARGMLTLAEIAKRLVPDLDQVARIDEIAIDKSGVGLRCRRAGALGLDCGMTRTRHNVSAGSPRFFVQALEVSA
jgi:hypothetical protein